ncbi:hypothetical protein D3C76_1263540 [compost metagenome]
MHPRCQHAVITDMHFTHVEDHAVKIGVEVFTQENVVTVIAAKSRLDGSSLIPAQQLGQPLFTQVSLVRGRMVVMVHQLACMLTLAAQ